MCHDWSSFFLFFECERIYIYIFLLYFFKTLEKNRQIFLSYFKNILNYLTKTNQTIVLLLLKIKEERKMKLKFKCPKCDCEVITHVSKPGDTVQCKNCYTNVEVPEDAIECPNFYDSPTFIPMNETPIDSYPALRGIAGFLTFLAWLSAMIGIGIAIYGGTLFDSYRTGDAALPTLLTGIFGGMVGFIIFKFQAEIIYLFIDIKEDLSEVVKNTRGKY